MPQTTRASPPNNRNRNPKPFTPKWKINVTKKINSSRAIISQIQEYLTKPNPSARLTRKINKLKRDNRLSTNNQLRQKQTELKVEVPALALLIKTTEAKINTKKHNAQFNSNARKFYQQIIQEKISVTNPPPQEQLEQYWRPLYEEAIVHNSNANWIPTIAESNRTKPTMNAITITTGQISNKVKSFPNFKATGTDKIPNYWIKQLAALHPHLASAYNRILANTESPPDWFTTGITTLIPKSNDTHLPHKYRPICCLNTTYKLFTGLLADEVYCHIENGQYLEEEQRGSRRNCMGTKDQLLLNRAILEDARRRQRNLSMAWIDYQKAYDSVPHSWLIACMKLYKIHPTIVSALSSQMENWKTTI